MGRWWWSGLGLAMGLALGAGAGPSAVAQTPTEVSLTIESDRFVPEVLRVKAGAPFVLVITNHDTVRHELDVPQLRIEQRVRSGETVRLRMPTLKPGTYELVDDDSMPELKGKLVAE